MDLSKLVDYDLTVPVEIHKDKDGAVVFNVRSIDNAESQRIMAKRRATMMGKRVAKDGDALDDETAEIMTDMIDPPPEILATCVMSWDWGGHTFGDMGKNPKFTPENVAETLRYKWIKNKVQFASQNIGNFTQA